MSIALELEEVMRRSNHQRAEVSVFEALVM
jgi:hypothetical protein